MNVKTARNSLAAIAIATGALFTSAVVKTPKAETEEAKIETTYDAMKNAADKATDNSALLGTALALELMGVGMAGRAMKRNRTQIEKANVETETTAQDKESKICDIRTRITSLEDEISDAIIEYKKLDAKRNEWQKKYFEHTKDIISSEIAAKDVKPRYLGYELAHHDDGIRITDGHDVYESRMEVEARCNKALHKMENAKAARNEIEHIMQLYEEQMEDLHIHEKKIELENLKASLQKLLFS